MPVVLHFVRCDQLTRRQALQIEVGIEFGMKLLVGTMSLIQGDDVVDGQSYLSGAVALPLLFNNSCKYIRIVVTDRLS